MRGTHRTQTAQQRKAACLSKVIASSLYGWQASTILSDQDYLARALPHSYNCIAWTCAEHLFSQMPQTCGGGELPAQSSIMQYKHTLSYPCPAIKGKHQSELTMLVGKKICMQRICRLTSHHRSPMLNKKTAEDSDCNPSDNVQAHLLKKILKSCSQPHSHFRKGTVTLMSSSVR